MKTRLATLTALIPLLAAGAIAEPAKQALVPPIPVADLRLRPIGESIPPGAFAYAETSGLAELIRGARGSELYQTIATSDSAADFLVSDESRGLRTAVGWAQFMLRMDLWEAAEKLLSS